VRQQKVATMIKKRETCPTDCRQKEPPVTQDDASSSPLLPDTDMLVYRTETNVGLVTLLASTDRLEMENATCHARWTTPENVEVTIKTVYIK
jgi:hypothetical protein